MKIIALLLTFVFSVIAKNDPVLRTMHGSPGSISGLPYVVTIFFKNIEGQTTYCGGALICKDWVLTAADCIESGSLFVLYFGTSNLTELVDPGRVVVQTDTGFVHDEYNNVTKKYNVGLLNLKEPIEFSKYISSVPLRDIHVGESVEVYVNAREDIIKNGIVSTMLTYIKLKTIPTERCLRPFGSMDVNSTICAHGNPRTMNPCITDLGAPLLVVVNGRIEHVGVTSLISNQRCDSGHPTGYVRTEHIMPWIKKTVNVTSCKLL